MKVSKPITGKILLAIFAVAAIVLVLVNGINMVASPPDGDPKPGPENATNLEIIPVGEGMSVQRSPVGVVVESYHLVKLPYY